MGVRLIRENSDTPNVTNKDDARMVRYAYGGQNGYAQKYGRELDYIPNGNIFTIGSGMAVLQGWEVVVDSNGWQLELSTSDVTKRYYLVYLEVNLTLGGSAEIKSKTDELDYPTIEEGDDLTENLNGIAYLELYRFTATRGVVADVEKRVPVILYTKETGARPRVTQIINADPDKLYVLKSSYNADDFSEGYEDITDPISDYDGDSLCPLDMNVLPLGAGNSIASIEFLDGDWKDYIVFSCSPLSNGNVIRFEFERFLQNIYKGQWKDGTSVNGTLTSKYGYKYQFTYHQYDVKCKIKDIYGNEFFAGWTVAFSTYVRLEA